MPIYGKNEGLLPDPRRRGQQFETHLAKIEEIFGHLSHLTVEQKFKMAEQRRRLADALNTVVTQPEAKI